MPKGKADKDRTQRALAMGCEYRSRAPSSSGRAQSFPRAEERLLAVRCLRESLHSETRIDGEPCLHRLEAPRTSRARSERHEILHQLLLRRLKRSFDSEFAPRHGGVDRLLTLKLCCCAS